VRPIKSAEFRVQSYEMWQPISGMKKMDNKKRQEKRIKTQDWNWKNRKTPINN